MAYGKFVKPIDVEDKKINLRTFHLAGIIPADTSYSWFRMPWSDTLMPIAPNYTAIEYAVFVAAWAGCETIWIVCPPEQIQLIKSIVGEWINDPVEQITPSQFHVQHLKGKKIPIFYVSPRSQDKLKNEGIVWSILWGAKVACSVSKRISWWLEPDGYFVSFPQSVFSYNIIRQYRLSDISSKHRFYVSYQGKTVREGAFLPFTFRSYDLKRFVSLYNTICQGKFEFKIDEDGMEVKKIGREWSNTGRYVRLEDVFRVAAMGTKSRVVDTPWYFPIWNWLDYKKFLSSVESECIKRPTPHLLAEGKFRKTRDLFAEEEKKETS